MSATLFVCVGFHVSEHSSEISLITAKACPILEDMAVSTISNVARDNVVLVLSCFAFLIKLIYCIYIVQNGRTVGADKTPIHKKLGSCVRCK